MILALLLLLQAPQDDAAATKALAEFDAAYSKTKDSNARVNAVSILAQGMNEKIVGRLGSLLTGEDKTVRTAAASGLGGYTKATPDLKKSAARALISSLNSGANLKEVDIRCSIFAALGTLQEESSGTALKPHFEDKDTKIAGAAIGAAGSLKTKTMVDPLIELLRECEKNAKSGPTGGSASNGKTYTPKKGAAPPSAGNSQPDSEQQKRDRASALIPVIQSALQNLTKQSLMSSDEWEKWWIKNRATFTPAP